MKVWFMQVYTEPGVNFPFSHHFQGRMSREVTALVKPSGKFSEKYGEDFELMFRISAKESLQENLVTGPDVFRKTKDVEYLVFLPFGVIMRHADAPKVALQYLLKGVCDVFDRLEIDTTKLLEKRESLIAGICADPTMLEEPSFWEPDNRTRQRIVFTKFFHKSR